MLAISKNASFETISVLLEAGADPNHCTLNKRSALLSAAAAKASPAVFELLLKSGAQVNQTDYYSNNALVLYFYRIDETENKIKPEDHS